MDKKTREALEASIKHWEDNAKAETPDDYSVSWRDCALCGLFFTDRMCAGCPIQERTGRHSCSGTPYEEATMAHANWKMDQNMATGGIARAAALEMVDFLKGLRPVEDVAQAALEKSIAHWEENVRLGKTGKQLKLGPNYCALCKEFAAGRSSFDMCHGCPVREKTGKPGCYGTPYSDVLNADYGQDQLKVAQAMLDFLIDLRPKEEPKENAVLSDSLTVASFEYNPIVTKQERPTGEVRWVTAPVDRVLQQRWRIVTYKDGFPSEEDFQWRNVPVEADQ